MNNNHIPFRIRYDLEERIEKYKSQKEINPNLCPLIVEPKPTSKLEPLKSCRFCCEPHKNLLYLKVAIGKKVYGDRDCSKSGFYMYAGKKLLVDGTFLL